MRIAVIGGGSWGTALSNLLAKKGNSVGLWVLERELVAEMHKWHENSWYLPGIPLVKSLIPSNDLAEVLKGVTVVLMAVPSQHIRTTYGRMREFLPKKPVIICASKGNEVQRLRTMSQIAEEELDGFNPIFAMLSGPSFAVEVARGLPTAIVLSCLAKKYCRELQKLFATDSFRVYINSDVRGVELGGAVKNIVAIAVGIVDSLGFGYNARAALITRGLAEMGRLGRAMGGKLSTFMGLSAMGDLVLTCTGELSRNRQVGLLLGQGQMLQDIMAAMKTVAEGIKTTEAVYILGRQFKVELPITAAVYNILYEGKDPQKTMKELMTRALKEE
ncbi:Glycerol-3-phosphate dehydrogenase (NAD(P)+) [Desulfovibrionales bacterium]